MDRNRPHETAEMDPTTCEPMEDFTYAEAAIELACSIVDVGQLHNAKIFEYEDGRRVIVAGNRRWMACMRAGLPLLADIWCFTKAERETDDFAQAMRKAENGFRRKTYRRTRYHYKSLRSVA